jgi:glycosyltransferase involved in cell wall biosynthesis
MPTEFDLKPAGNPAPIVSVVVVTRGYGENFDKCINSLLKQEFPSEKFEIVIVSKSPVQVDICRAPKVRIYQQESLNTPGKARNFGVKMANGRIVAFCDDDCEAPRDWLKRITQDFDENPDIVGVLGFYSGGKGITRIFNREEISNKKIKGYPLGFREGNAAFIKNAVERVGGFGEFSYSEGNVLAEKLCRVNYKTLEDYDLRVVHHSQPLTISKSVAAGRSHYYNSNKYSESSFRSTFLSFATFLSVAALVLGIVIHQPFFLSPFLLLTIIFGVYSSKQIEKKNVLLSTEAMIWLVVLRWTFWLSYFLVTLKEFKNDKETIIF